MKLSINTSSKYDIIIKPNLINAIDGCLDEFNSGQLFVLCYSKPLSVKAQKIYSILKNKLYNIELLEIPDGESAKQFDSVQIIIQNLIDLDAKRDTVLLGLGGGSISDSIGFVASIYMRGIRYINIPTTLLAMVDSSLGGKTGINYSDIKNVLGAFCHPSKVCIDPTFIESLSAKEIRSGLGEIIKYGFIANHEIIKEITHNYNCIIQLKNKDLIQKLIFECCLIKKKYIESDEKDVGIRNILNFGHTLGHIIESKYIDQSITHGEAIINGMFLSVELSYFKKIMSDTDYKYIQSIFHDLNIGYTYKLERDDIENIKFDKKVSTNKHRFILLKSIGQPIICDDVSKDDILSVI